MNTSWQGKLEQKQGAKGKKGNTIRPMNFAATFVRTIFV